MVDLGHPCPIMNAGVRNGHVVRGRGVSLKFPSVPDPRRMLHELALKVVDMPVGPRAPW